MRKINEIVKVERVEVAKSVIVLEKELKIYGDLDEPKFLAKDIAEWIEHSRASEMLKTIDEEEKLMQTILASGQNRDMWFVTEDGLYEILMQSRKPIAKKFKKEVKHILRDLRRGKTITPTLTPAQMVEKVLADSVQMIEMLQNETIQLTTNLQIETEKVEKLEDKLKTFYGSSTLANTTTVAKQFGISSARKLNQYLKIKGVCYKSGSTWVLYSGIPTEYAQITDSTFNGIDTSSMKWTKEGKTYIYDILMEDEVINKNKQGHVTKSSIDVFFRNETIKYFNRLPNIDADFDDFTKSDQNQIITAFINDEFRKF